MEVFSYRRLWGAKEDNYRQGYLNLRVSFLRTGKSL